MVVSPCCTKIHRPPAPSQAFGIPGYCKTASKDRGSLRLGTVADFPIFHLHYHRTVSIVTDAAPFSGHCAPIVCVFPTYRQPIQSLTGTCHAFSIVFPASTQSRGTSSVSRVTTVEVGVDKQNTTGGDHRKRTDTLKGKYFRSKTTWGLTPYVTLSPDALVSTTIA